MKKIRDKIDIEEMIEQFSKTIYKIAFSYTQCKDTAEDVIQNVFIRYMTSDKEFESTDHKKGWIIKVTINECKKVFRWRIRNYRNEEQSIVSDCPCREDGINDHVMNLPKKYRVVVHLYYYEQLSVKEIGETLNLNANTVMSLLYRARQRLKKVLEREYEY